ncbi:MAG: IS982 family transposase, partial [Epsilonproteobacteria bacterium]|nr:IS982 family transposase [Campylobacterota bacterium]
TGRFGNVIKATSIDGFLTKLKLFITAYSMDCFLKLSTEQQNQLAI